MGIAANLEGRTVPGKKMPGLWTILDRLTDPDGNSGGKRSFGYRVRHESGKEGFLKASDADLAHDNDESIAVRLQAVLMHHSFEAGVSEHCRGNSMDRVSLTIDFGDAMLENNGVKEPLFYLIFELADGDVRTHALIEKNWTFAQKFSLLHHVTVGISQLHGALVSHNDIKPPNILVYSDGHRVADLGQATREDILAPHDCNAIVGDPRYAAPEVLYAKDGKPGQRIFSNESRRACDLYLLGSFIYYLFCGRMLTPSLVDRMSALHRPLAVGGWGGTFLEVLPYWRAAFGEEIECLADTLAASADPAVRKYADQIVDCVLQLSEPDPARRGHPAEIYPRGTHYSLKRYVSLFDRLAQVG
ncbi:protein kinase domain-containing protein [Mesorhizobium australicum]|uniref:Protein kinase domain-containing protein n=1 Tax=Mesorhizobium australicum TaxID=536018 RepID=A0A1X7N446_9HYPH|nr:serine/threonine-protein kinase [Mesorhizobium australicum]SMH32037.1 Protein kinase domain-containing protein [Mesorhizobium australicum]